MPKEVELKISPTHKQQEAWTALFDDAKRFVFFGGGAGSGKSWLGCEWLMVLAYSYPGLKAYIGRKELKRLMASTYLTQLKVFKHHGVQDDWKLNGQYNYLESKSTGSRIDLLDLDFQPSDPLFERFGSTEYSVGFNDEAGEIDFLAYDVLKSRLGRHIVKNAEGKELISKMLSTFNPTKNWLYPNVYKEWKKGTLPPHFAFIQALYKDNPHTAESYGFNLEEIQNKAMKQRLMFGNWEYDDDPSALINYDAIIDLFTNSAKEGGKYLTADIARHGKDKTVIIRWDGLHAVDIQTYAKLGTDESARIIRDTAFKFKIPYSQIIVDEDGIGGGVKDTLKGIKGFIANSSPLSDPDGTKENFKNLKAQCSWKLASLINEHELAVTCEDSKVKNMLIEELEQIKSKNDDREAKKQIVGKEDIKDILGRSPDYADALMFRAYFLLYEKFNPLEPMRGEIADKLQAQFRKNEKRQMLNSTK